MKKNNVNQEVFVCSGCASCANICPVGAISMTTGKNGFYVPQIDITKCTNCGL